MRPNKLATDAAATNGAIVYLLDWRNENGQMDPDLIMVLQPTSPFRRDSALAEAVKLIKERDDVDSVVGMKRIDRPVLGLFLVDQDGLVT
jgi:CMP-N-acetylneuraminic acid synthetase